eukprot:587516-Heterocapsa_arctica.AAC.1
MTPPRLNVDTAAAGASDSTGIAGVHSEWKAPGKAPPPKVPAKAKAKAKVSPPVPPAAAPVPKSWRGSSWEDRSSDRARNIIRLSGANDPCSKKKSDILSRLDNIIRDR